MFYTITERKDGKFEVRESITEDFVSPLDDEGYLYDTLFRAMKVTVDHHRKKRGSENFDIKVKFFRTPASWGLEEES